MNINPDQENQINANLYVIGTKLKALKATLTPDQLEKYNQIIESEKDTVLSLWEKVLSPEDFAQLERALLS